MRKVRRLCNDLFHSFVDCCFRRHPETVTEPRKIERRKTEHRKGPNIEKDRTSKDRTSKDRTSNGTEHRKTECRMGANIERLNVERPNLEWDRISKDWTSKRTEHWKTEHRKGYISVFSTMSQYLNKNYCNDRYTTVVGKGTFKKLAELLYFNYLKK